MYAPLALQSSSFSLVKLPILSRRCGSRRKCLIEFRTRQLHLFVGDRSLSLADSVLKETDKNSESFTVHRSRAQASFDPTPAAAAAAPTETLYFNAERERERSENEISVPADQIWM